MADVPRPLRPALLLALAALGGFGGLLLLRAATAERVAAQQREAERQAVAVVLPLARFENDLEADAVHVVAPAWLGSEAPLRVRRARLQGRPSALLVEAVAPDGYNGAIHLLVAVDAGGTLLGARVLEHHETPGLGDPIDAERSPWIDGFRGRSLGDPALPGWRVRRDGGAFDQFAGATITPRAVIGALRRALQFAATHGPAVQAAPAGATLRFDDAPEAP